MRVKRNELHGEILKKISKECAEWRKKNGITQREISGEIGFSPQTITQFEQGISNNALILFWYIMNGFEICENQAAWDALNLFSGGKTNDQTDKG